MNDKKYLRDLSKSNIKKVGIIATLIGDPETVILDKPFVNLDLTTVSRPKKIIIEFSDYSNVKVLVSSHDLLQMVEICNRIVAINKKQILKNNRTSPENL